MELSGALRDRTGEARDGFSMKVVEAEQRSAARPDGREARDGSAGPREASRMASIKPSSERSEREGGSGRLSRPEGGQPNGLHQTS